MKNLTIVKKVLVMVIMVAVICLSTSVFAAESSFTSLGSPSANNSASGSNQTSGNTSNNSSNTSNSSNSSTNLSTTSNTSSSTANSTNNTTTLNSSYNSTNLPETGLQDSLPIVVLIVVLGISAVYAYKKVKDYQSL